ncbi:hypothetical protein R3P38DRAFT_3186105 [Favolaschia claudopus]|uniref:Uncharacterized protein n=1 Tax=Favolaschia claudopus TaxID=2862362 RepID=A0AAW0C668_9AGAR
MDELYFKDSTGEFIIPIWTVNGEDSFCSFFSQFSDTSSSLLDYRDPVPYLLGDQTPIHVLKDVGYDLFAFWYKPQQHWLGYIPTGPPPSEAFDQDWVDPLAVAFDESKVHYQDSYADGFGDDDDGEPIPPQWCGYDISTQWVQDVCTLSHKLEFIWRSFVSNGLFYRKGRMPGITGDLPNVVNGPSLTSMLTSESEVDDVVFRARLALRSQIGFISWLLTVSSIEEAKLSEDYVQLLMSMRLPDRPKVGMVFDLSRDANEVNFKHLVDHHVPFHYSWTANERRNSRFLRYSPQYYNEVEELLKARSRSLLTDLRVQDLKNYPVWRRKLAATDWNLRNLQGGKRGEVLKEFNPKWDFEVIDEFGYGARPLYHWNVIRAYTERFKGALHEGEHGTLCTLFRYDPISVDEPPLNRPTPVHKFPLTTFATNCSSDFPPEKDFYYDSTTRVRERSKNLYAPRPDRVFNNFNGHLIEEIITRQGPRLRGRPYKDLRQVGAKKDSSSGSYGEVLEPSPLKDRLGPRAPQGYSPPPSPRDSRAGSPAFKGEWARKMAEGGSLPIPSRASRSLSPHRADKGKKRQRSLSVETSRTMDSRGRNSDPSFEEEIYEISSSSPQNIFIPVSVEPPSAIDDIPVLEKRASGIAPFPGTSTNRPWAAYQYDTKEEAISAIARQAYAIIDLEPEQGEYSDMEWSKPWFNQGVLVFEDPRSLLRLKTLVAMYPHALNNMQAVLEYAMRYSMPFEIYIPLAWADAFRDASLTDLSRSLLPSIYGAGFSDQLMTWAGLGEEHQYGLYMESLLRLLVRPNAVSFISMGGVCKFIAETYSPDIAKRFAKGPSAQVSEFAKGKTKRLDNLGRASGLYTTDQVSPAEVSMLLGHIKGKTVGTDKTLWPPQSILEKYSSHVRGYLSAGAYKMLCHLRDKILVERSFEWRTRADWVTYVRLGGRGKFTPAVIPSQGDFDHTARLLRYSFPRDWSCEKVSNVLVPEMFEPQLDLDEE